MHLLLIKQKVNYLMLFNMQLVSKNSSKKFKYLPKNRVSLEKLNSM